MMSRVVQFYGGPLCGDHRQLGTPSPRGWRVNSVARDSYFYVHDGAGRYVYTQTLEGQFIQAEIEETKRGEK